MAIGIIHAVHLPRDVTEGKIHKLIQTGLIQETGEKKSDTSTQKQVDIRLKKWEDFIDFLESLEPGTRFILFCNGHLEVPFLGIFVLSPDRGHDKRGFSVSALEPPQ